MLSIGSDGVVCYVLVIQVVGGGWNVIFEGMCCEMCENWIYVFGCWDGMWLKLWNNEWFWVKNVYVNWYYVVLFFEYFCLFGVIVCMVEEVKEVLWCGEYLDNKCRGG